MSHARPPLFTQRHYEFIARELRSALEAECSYSSEAVAIHLAGAFTRDNPRFNRDKFEKACGLIVINDTPSRS